MSTIIQDGTGTGKNLKIDGSNRARVFATTETQDVNAIQAGDYYVFNTGYYSISGNSSLFYFKNNETRNFITTGFVLAAQTGITYSNYPVINVYKNITGGDLLTDESAVDVNQNLNFGSAKSITADIYKGKDGGTVSGGNLIGVFQVGQGGRFFAGTTWIIPPGATIAFSLIANISSGSADHLFLFQGYLQDETSN